MDALSSQATVAGYKAVLIAAEQLPRFFPMLTTAAGTVAPAKVLVLGAGVAGLQAIATARRLGAVVAGFDVRPAVQEQVESLGATFLDLGVARRGDRGRLRARAERRTSSASSRRRSTQRIPDYDVVITTALDSRAARRRSSSRRRRSRAMRPGSVIVDLAAEAGGNCELTEPGRDRRARRRHARRPHEPAVDDAVPREPAVRTNVARAAPAPRAGRRARRSTGTTRSPPAPASRTPAKVASREPRRLTR